MKATFINRVLGFWLIVFFPTLSYADVPSGHYENHFDRQPYGVWDLSGTYHNAMYLGGLIDDGIFNFVLIQDDAGKISGQGTIAGGQNGYDANGSFTASGSIKSKRNVTRAVLKTRIVATVTDGFNVWDATGNVKLAGHVDKPSGGLQGTVKGKMCAQGTGCESVDETAQLLLPVETNGAWDLHLDVTNVDGKKLTGIATAFLQNGNGEIREVSFALKGEYFDSADLAKLQLKGSGGKLTIRARATAGALSIQTMKGKLLGQAVNFP